MTCFYLDTEFNGFGGELISLALFGPLNAESFYEVMTLPCPVVSWVAENVIPKLGKRPIGASVFRERLRAFLKDRDSLVIYADWPADFEHLFHHLMVEGNWEVDIPLEARLIRSGEVRSTVPHNALADAIALSAWHEMQS